ncbi:MAG: hypothetical protein R3E58_05555 [Phycisphaerae bacterium]
MRFKATDGPASSDIVEVAIDDVLITQAECDPQTADLTGDSTVDLEDFRPHAAMLHRSRVVLVLSALYGPLVGNACPQPTLILTATSMVRTMRRGKLGSLDPS